MAAKKAARKTVKKAARKPAKKAPKKSAKKSSKKAIPKFGRMGTAGKADGDEPVFAYIAQLPPDQKLVALKVDDIVRKNVPGVRRAMKWSTPFYGIEGRGWFCAFGAFKAHTAVNFFRGKDLKPQPPEGEGKEMRRVIYSSIGDVDEAQLTSWIKQAAAIPGWGK